MSLNFLSAWFSTSFILLMVCVHCQQALDLHLKLGIYERPPASYLKSKPSSFHKEHEPELLILTSKNETLTYTGFWIPTIEWLSQSMNMSMTIVPLGKDLGTFFKSNNTWSGAIGRLLRGDVDVIGPPLLISGLRGSVLDFAGLCTTDDPVLASPIPHEEIASIGTIFEPFALEVWLLTLLSLPIVGSVLMAVAYFTVREEVSRFDNYLLYLLAILANQGELFIHWRHRLKFSFRIVCASWCLLSLVLVNLYQTTLTSHLAEIRFDMPPTDPSQLLEQGKFDLLILATGVGRELLLEARDGPEKKLGDYLRKRPKNFVASPEEGFRKVASGCCGYVDSRSYLDYLDMVGLDETGQCRVHIGKPFRGVIGYGGPAFAKKHPHWHLFHHKLLELNQSGLEQYWQKKSRRSDCQDRLADGILKKDSRGTTRQLTIRGTSGAFFFFVLGCSLSLLIFGIENRSRPTKKPTKF